MMLLGTNSMEVHGDTSVLFTTGATNDNPHLEQVEHKVAIGHAHTAKEESLP